MAKLSGPLFSANAVGRFAGSIVYNIWRGIQYGKKLTSPAQPRTPRQLLIRGFLAQLSTAWQSLSSGQRGAWQTWADNNQPADPQFNRNTPWSGMNAYVGKNIIRLDISEAVVDDPPQIPAPDPLANFAAADAAGDLTITWDGTPETQRCDLWWYKNVSPARNPNKQLMRHWIYVEGQLGTKVFVAAPAQTYYLYGSTINVADGQRSVWQSCKATIAP